MSYLAAASLKDAITRHTGLSARVSVRKGEFQAEPILPGTPQQLSRIQKMTLYVASQNESGSDKGCNLSVFLHAGIFDSQEQAKRILRNLTDFGWLRESYSNRFALTEQGSAFIASQLKPVV